jgi:hypothetical protein
MVTNHDTSSEVKQLLKQLNAVKHIDPGFNEITSSLDEIMNVSHSPAFLGILLFKILQEKEKSNKILFDLEKRLSFLEKNMSSSNSHTKEEEILAEPDQHIMQLVQKFGQVTAKDIQERLSYKNSNAASQRLNKLSRENKLKKLRAGKKVFFVLNK